MNVLKKTLFFTAFFTMMLIGWFSSPLFASGSGNITIQIQSIFDAQNTIESQMTNQVRGSVVSIQPSSQSDYAFSFWIVNGVVRPELPETHSFIVTSQMNLVAVFHKTTPLTHTVLFVDSNGKVLDTQFVLDGEAANEPSTRSTSPITLPVKPGFDHAETKWMALDETTSLSNITSSRVYILQYEKSTETTHTLTVHNGSGSDTYAYNQIATITANAAPEGQVFSHWQEDGTIISTQATFSFTLLKDREIQAIFSATPVASLPRVIMSEGIGLRDGYRSFLGQFYVPAGYTLVEYGFLTKSDGPVADINTLGVVIKQSNKYNVQTKEFLMSLTNESHNGVRAYLAVKNSENNVEYYYSDNYYTYVAVSIDYNGADGGNTTEEVTVLYGSTYVTLPTPTKTGLEFVGWSTAEYDMIVQDSIVETTADHTLTAQWMTEGLAFTAITGGYEVSKGTITASSVEVPAIYNNQKVIRVKNSGFSNYTTLESITLPETITRLENFAFERCTNLASITLPEALTHIGYGAFHTCTSILTLNLPNSIQTIDQYAFQYMTGSLVFAQDSTIETIGERAFAYYSNTSVTLPDSVLTISSNAFDSSSIQTLTVSDNLTRIGANALPSTWLNSKPDGFVYVGKVLYTYKGALPEGNAITIPDNTIAIASNAFKSQSLLTSVTIPEGVRVIGSEAFAACGQLTSVTFPDSLQYIDQSAFNGCSKLMVVELGDQITQIGNDAFSGCIRLQQFYLTKTAAMGVPTNLRTAEWGSDNLTIYVPNGSEAVYKSVWTGDASKIHPISIIDSNGYAIANNQLIQYTGSQTELIVPEGVTSLRNFAFKWLELDSILLPASLTTLGFQSFTETTGTVSFASESSLTTIPSNAFNNFKGTSIILPNSVETISEAAFANCINLVEFIVPNQVTSIGSNAFLNGVNLENITLSSSLLTIGNYAFDSCSKLTTITIPASVLSIGDYAFQRCSDLVELIIERNQSLGITTAGTNILQSSNANVTIYVPDIDSVAAYQAASNWSTYSSKIEVKP